jgi:hypothetical protein
MNASPFIRIQGKIIRLDSIAYVDFLDSGRSMIFMRGLTQEKQNIAVDPGETVRLRALLNPFLESEPEPAQTAGEFKFPDNRRWS